MLILVTRKILGKEPTWDFMETEVGTDLGELAGGSNNSQNRQPNLPGISRGKSRSPSSSYGDLHVRNRYLQP